MPRPIRAVIDIASMRHNLSTVSQAIRDVDRHAKCWAVIKANAYGHGIGAGVLAFEHADGLAMLDLEEAQQVRRSGWTKPILLLEGLFCAGDVQACEQLDLSLVIHCNEQIDWLSRARPTKPIDVYLKLDTGMHRLGMTPADYDRAFVQLMALRKQAIVGQVTHMTHFACADEPDGIDAAFTRFVAEAGSHPGAWCVANSAASLIHAKRIVEMANGRPTWWRPGISLYGSSPLVTTTGETACALGLKPTMTLRSELISVKTLRAGQGIGYGYRFRADRDMRVGVVACGYADGYPRHAPTGTPVFVAGHRTRLIGRVSMDMLTVDLSDMAQAQIGSDVVLWGREGPSVDDVATAAGTIGYELLTAVTARVPRVTE